MKEQTLKLRFKAIQRRYMIVLVSAFFVLSLIYFLKISDYVFSFQKEQFLFIFSFDYLKSFLNQPGGLLEYAGKFLMQFYEFPVAGAFILSVAITSSAYIVFKISDKLRPGSIFSLPVSLLISSLLLLMQTQYYHFMQYNLGFICILVVFLFTIRRPRSYLPVVILPLLYYIAGAYTFIYLLMYCAFYLSFADGKEKFIKPAILIITAGITLFISSEVFLIPTKTLLAYPLPTIENSFHRIFFFCMVTSLVLIPVVDRLQSSPPAQFFQKYFSLSATVMVFIGASLMVLKLRNPYVSTVLKMEGAAYESNWDEVLKINAKQPSDNLIGQYYYNTALAEKGLLCDRLFSISQGFGTKSLILPWGDSHLERGSMFFYASGLVNEAHRWAYEEMVVYGFRPHNMRMLIKTSLADNNFRMAGKYIDILKKTLFYRKEALYYESINGDPQKIKNDKELGAVENIIPKKDFFIYMDAPEDNLPSMFESNPSNTRAFEYMMAWLLLEKNIETVVSNVRLMKGMGYTRIPRNIEEAIMIYYNSQHVWPDMGGLTISSATLSRFDSYINTYVQTRNNNPARLQSAMKSGFGDTFWYFFHFAQIPVAGKK